MLDQVTPFGVISLINCLACAVLGIVLLARSKRDPVKLSYCIFDFCIVIYAFFYFLWQCTSNQSYSIVFFKLCIVGVILINSAFCQFTHAILKLKNRSTLTIVHSINAIFCVISPALFYNGWEVKYSYGIWPKPSTVFSVYLAWWFIQVIYCFRQLYNLGLRQSQSHDIKQMQWIFFSTLVAYSGGATNWLVWYGINFPPYLNSGIAIYSFVLAFAIYRYKLLGIDVFIKRAAVFAGLFAFVYSAFAVITILGNNLFTNTFNVNQWIALLPVSIIIISALRPLEALLSSITDKYLFQKKYDYLKLLRKITSEVLSMLDVNQLADKTVGELFDIMKLETAAFLLRDEKSHVFKVVAGRGVFDKHITINEHDKLSIYLQTGSQYMLRSKIPSSLDGPDIHTVFRSLNAEVIIPIETQGKMTGLLTLGKKKSDDDYSINDLDLLSSLAKAEAIALKNSQLFDDLSKVQAEAAQREKMAVIGTLAAGINHEICNPLGIVRGQCEMFLLNMRDGFYENKSREDLVKLCGDIMNKVIRETDRATAITKKLSGFAKPSKNNDMEEVLIEREVQEVLGLLGQDLKLNNIDIQTDIPANFPVFLADRKQIEEVLFNIIRNGAQAIDKKQGKILVSGFAQNGSAIIRIADNGSGIPKESLERIFHPFYTTKAPGKGTGLGLFIVKQIVERNRGTIAVESEVGIGTTFTLKFPTAVKAITAAA